MEKILLISANFIVFFLIGKLFFKNWKNFLKGLTFLLTPNIFKIFKPIDDDGLTYAVLFIFFLFIIYFIIYLERLFSLIPPNYP